ncbi:hypothetical protein [Longivirga aurantiaca]|uniref:Uncharacterized protein n=1 Tax=Longivirga aurantiaca TaxID=1837743 RepID=A0ABW1T0V5_9ACTN
MKRLFWLGVGAAAGYYAARRGEEAVERARERGVVGNVTLAATTASKVAATASRTAVTLGEKARALAADPAGSETATVTPIRPAAGTSPSSPASSPSREVRP